MSDDRGELLCGGHGEAAGGHRVAERGKNGSGIPEGCADPALGQASRFGKRCLCHGPALLHEEDDKMVGDGEPPSVGTRTAVGAFPGEQDRDRPAEEATPVEIASWSRGHGTVENAVHWCRAVTFGKHASQICLHPHTPAVLGDLIRFSLKLAGWAKAAAQHAHTDRHRALTLYGLTCSCPGQLTRTSGPLGWCACDNGAIPLPDPHERGVFDLAGIEGGTVISSQKAVGAADAARGKFALGWAGRVALILLPLVSVGLLSPVPSVVLAARHRRVVDWAAVAGFTLTWVLWVAALAEWPDGGTGLEFAATFVLLIVNTVGAALHCLLAWSPRPQH